MLPSPKIETWSCFPWPPFYNSYTLKLNCGQTIWDKIEVLFSSLVPRKEKGKKKFKNALRCYWEHLKEHIENLKNN
jgi:hypothetical protein